MRRRGARLMMAAAAIALFAARAPGAVAASAAVTGLAAPGRVLEALAGAAAAGGAPGAAPEVLLPLAGGASAALRGVRAHAATHASVPIIVAAAGRERALQASPRCYSAAVARLVDAGGAVRACGVAEAYICGSRVGDSLHGFFACDDR